VVVANAAVLPADPVVVAAAAELVVAGGMDLPGTGSTDALLVVLVVDVDGVASDPPQTPILEEGGALLVAVMRGAVACECCCWR